MPETSASRMKTGRAVLGPAQPPRGPGTGRGHAGQVDPGRRQQRVAVQAPQPDQPGPLLLGPDGDTAPGVGQVAGGPLVVGQAGAGDGGHGGGHALVVGDELGGGEAVLAGPLIPVAEAEGLGEQRPLGGQPPGLAGPLPGGGLLGMPAGLAGPQPPAEQDAGQGGGAADQGQQQRQADQGGQHQRTPPPGPQGSAAAGDQQPVTAALDQLPVAVVGQVGPAAAGMPAGRAGRAVGAVGPHQPATPSTTAAAGRGRSARSPARPGRGQLPQGGRGPWMVARPAGVEADRVGLAVAGHPVVPRSRRRRRARRARLSARRVGSLASWGSIPDARARC